MKHQYSSTLYTDGGCSPTNPGHAAFACVLTLPDGTTHQIARYLGWRTNNYAEWAGMLVGLKLALDHNVTNLDIYTDSQLIRGQLSQNWKVKEPTLKAFHRDSAKLLGKFNRAIVHWVPREQNTVADALCGAVIAKARSNNPFIKNSVINADFSL